MKIHILRHESFEAPGAIEIWAKDRGHEISQTHFYKGDILPENTDGIDFLVVMGGPQSPATTIEECPHFDAQKEISFIKQAIDNGKYVLGVCLGAQLIGEALGAKFDHSPNKEIGVFNLTLTDAANNDPIFKDFPKIFPVGHWHGDMPGLTADSALLATSEGCPRQIVRYTPRVYGFQCHFEFTPEAIEGMITYCKDELETLKGFPYIWTEEQLRKADCKSFNQLLFKFLDRFVK